ncbi:MAG: hypothetical protein COW12_05705 [Candidatus Omnitrophica bacterium CG12_big_fil_rev_8_21_14_0_65_45_16]|nr:MAG: hypothetical protein COW12_05705 [Candidatus Omnitrophica bacterium CG12_big_fil_rev_8_21_14_0_65_45_16]
MLCTYGGQIKKVLQIANRSSVLQRPLSPQHPLIGAQVIYAIEHEMARTLMDVCVRRLRLDQMPGCGLDTVGQAADLMAARLNWSWLQKEKEILEYQSWVRQQTEFLF